MGQKIISLIFALAILTTGCGKDNKLNTFSKGRLARDIIDLCKKENNVDVEAEIVENTLYVYLTVDDIILTTKGLSEVDQKKIQDVTLIASRAGLSTYSDIKFYKIIASDNKNIGIELVITRFVLDIKKFMHGALSRQNFIDRMDMEVVFNPGKMGNQFARAFFKDLSSGDAKEIIKTYFPDNISLNKVSPTFFAMLMEHSLKKNINYDVKDIKIKRLSKFKSLVYAKVYETYEMADPESEYKFSTPTDFTNEYVFAINTRLFPKIIESMHSFNKINSEGQLENYGFPTSLKKHENISSWNTSIRASYKESVPVFIIKQITNAIKRKFTNKKNLKRLYQTKFVTGQYLDKDGLRTIQFNIDIDRNESPEALNLMDGYYVKILDEALTEIAIMLRSYEFEDFDRLYILYSPKRKQIILDKELVHKFYRKKISVNELLTMSEVMPMLLNSPS